MEALPDRPQRPARTLSPHVRHGVAPVLGHGDCLRIRGAVTVEKQRDQSNVAVRPGPVDESTLLREGSSYEGQVPFISVLSVA